MRASTPEPVPRHGWLSVVIPADARRFRVRDPFLAEVLREAGAEIVEDFPDVEIAHNDVEALGDAPLTVVHLPAGNSAGALPARIAKRLARSLGVRLSAGAIERGMRRRGFGHTSVLLWDLAQSARLPDGTFGRRRRPVEYMPRNGLVTAAKSRPGSTVLDAVVAKASGAVGRSLRVGGVSVMGSGLIVDVGEGILRVAVGSGSRQVLGQFKTLSRLRAAQPPPLVAERLPEMLAAGRCGLAEWSLETKLPGQSPGPAPGPKLLAEIIDFLVALHQVRPDGGASSMAGQVETIAHACSREGAAIVRELALRLETALEGISFGFGHGDFFYRNLLAKDGRLSGVIDWDAGGPGRLPLVDLLHFRHGATNRADEDWGPYVTAVLLPAARAGGDRLVEAYCAALKIDPDPRLLEALTVGYWLEYASYQLRTHPLRLHQHRWLDRNINGVLRELDRSGMTKVRPKDT